MRKFLDRIYALADRLSADEPAEGTLRALAAATEKAGADSERFKFNTALSALMVLVNELSSLKCVPKEAWAEFLRLLAPFSPRTLRSTSGSGWAGREACMRPHGLKRALSSLRVPS